MARVLVTGLKSAYGGALASRLRDRGDTVRGLVLPGTSAEESRRSEYEIVFGDIRDAAAVDRAVAGCDLVFHLAALYRSDNVADADFFDVNVEGTRLLLDAARRHGVRRFVHVSTIGVHGHVQNPPADEESPQRPRDPYQRSKLEGERLALSYFRNGMAGSVVRPSAIYGPGDIRLLKLYRAVQKRWFVMLGPGTALYHLVYIDDLVDGTLLCAERDAAVGEAFIIAGEESVTVGELVNRVANALGVPPTRLRLPLRPFQIAAPICQRVFRAMNLEPPLYPRRLEFFSDDRSFVISKAQRLLGYQPRVGLDEGIRRTIQWYREQRLLS